MKRCKVDGCDKPVRYFNCCEDHWQEEFDSRLKKVKCPVKGIGPCMVLIHKDARFKGKIQQQVQRHKETTQSSYRLAFERKAGREISEDKVAFHICEPKDTAKRVYYCCNPDHILEKTAKENTAAGTRGPRSTPKQAHEVHRLADAGKSIIAIAKETGLGTKQISNIIYGETHPEVARRYKKKRPEKRRRYGNGVRVGIRTLDDLIEQCEERALSKTLDDWCLVKADWSDERCVNNYISVCVADNGEQMRALRAVLFREVGHNDFPNANHLCHVKGCIKADHLQAGTQKENIQQTIATGALAGENGANAQYTNKEVVRLHEQYYLEGISLEKIAENISTKTMRVILRGISYKKAHEIFKEKHGLTEEDLAKIRQVRDIEERSCENHPNSVITNDKLMWAFGQYYIENRDLDEIAEDITVNINTLNPAIAGHTWKLLYKRFQNETGMTEKQMSDIRKSRIGAKTKTGEGNYRATITNKQARTALELYYHTDKTSVEIADEFNTSVSALQSLFNGKSWEPIYKKFMQDHEYTETDMREMRKKKGAASLSKTYRQRRELAA